MKRREKGQKNNALDHLFLTKSEQGALKVQSPTCPPSLLSNPLTLVTAGNLPQKYLGWGRAEPAQM